MLKLHYEMCRSSVRNVLKLIVRCAAVMGPRKMSKKGEATVSKEAGASKKGEPVAPKKVRKARNAQGKGGAKDGAVGTRCSPQLFKLEMKNCWDVLTTDQRAAVMRTPFAHFLKCSDNYNNVGWVQAIVDRFDSERQAFIFPNGVSVALRSRELSCVLGLRNVGLRVHRDLKKTPETVRRYFDGRNGNVNRQEIIKVLHQVAGKEEWAPGKRDARDFARIFILWVFNTILFPTGHYSVPAHVIHQVDNLDIIDEYAWGEAVHEFLVSSLAKRTSEGRLYVDGCTFGLVVWSHFNFFYFEFFLFMQRMNISNSCKCHRCGYSSVFTAFVHRWMSIKFLAS